MRSPTAFILMGLLSVCPALLSQSVRSGLPHNRPLVDAHTCYPYDTQWKDRIDRALGTGFPIAIEQDLAWAIDPASLKGRAVVSHSARTSGSEPSLRDHFFEHVRPLMERALRENRRAEWPLVTVHFDFKDNRPELHRAVWELLGEYEAWITTAPKLNDPAVLSGLQAGPLLVLTEDNDSQEQAFFTSLPVGARLRLFGAAHTASIPAPSREERIRLACLAD